MILCLIFNFLLNTIAEAHPWKPDHYVIIDTDCGLDDFRTINLLLASSNIRVLAIITSNGVVSAKDGFVKVKSLLNEKHQEGILVGMNTDSIQIARNCELAKRFLWTDSVEDQQTKLPVYTDILNQVFAHCSEKVVFINLGGLNTLNSYLKAYPTCKEKIKEVLWTCNYTDIKSNFNYLIDTLAYELLDEKNVQLNYINGNSFGTYNHSLIEELKRDDSHLAQNMCRSLCFSENPFAKNMFDESVLFYLLNKQIFHLDTINRNKGYSLDSEIDLDSYVLDFIRNYEKTQHQVLSFFPMDKSDYNSDISDMMVPTIKKFGNKEWAACVLTSEIHGHIGVYSLIGAKMGIRACEYFGVGVDELHVVSFAGNKPPYSCLNDGLQVSTGATLGQGLISVDEKSQEPKAEFYYLGQKITITLNPEYQKKIASEIKELSIIYGLDSNVYWDLVRDNALRYWAHWNRNDIFEIEKD